MKRWSSMILAVAIVFVLAACGQTNTNQESAAASQSQGEPIQQPETTAGNPDAAESVGANSTEAGSKVLVAYFTWSGNTEVIAAYLAEQTGGDLLKIEPETPYPTDYSETGELAKIERDENQRPAIANLPESLDAYDTIFIGYPIWWHTAPMMIGTFLESYDLTGKEIYPFTQSSSMDTEQFENSMEFVRNSAGSGTVHDGLFTRASNTDAIDTYLAGNGF